MQTHEKLSKPKNINVVSGAIAKAIFGSNLRKPYFVNNALGKPNAKVSQNFTHSYVVVA